MFRLMRWSIAPVFALVLLNPMLAAADVPATVVLKSGERHTGTGPVMRLDKPQLMLKTGSGDHRVSVDQVLYVDFGGSANVDPQISGSQAAVVLRNGTVVRGQLIEMGYEQPDNTSSTFLVIFKDDQGREHRWPSGEVSRVYFSPPTSGTAGTTTNPAASSAVGIVVPANRACTPTGVAVRRGEVVNLSASGEIRLSNNPDDIAAPAGSKSGRTAANAPLPQAFAGALLGRIGNARPFAIGNNPTLTAPASGQLFLCINDDGLEDNTGEFRVEVSRANRVR